MKEDANSIHVKHGADALRSRFDVEVRNGPGDPVPSAPNGKDADGVAPLSGVITPKSLGDKSPPARAWIVPDWLPCGVVTGLYGDGGLGKSLLAQQLQTAAATGKTWLGLSVERTVSLAVYCEDSNDELWRRQRDINLDYGVSNNDLGDVHWMPRLGEDNLMMVFGRNGAGELTKFHQHILIASLHLKAKLVIIDVAADVFGGNENDRNHVRQFVSRALGSIAQKINGAVLLCAHPSRAGLNKGADGAEGELRINGLVEFASLAPFPAHALAGQRRSPRSERARFAAQKSELCDPQ